MLQEQTPSREEASSSAHAGFGSSSTSPSSDVFNEMWCTSPAIPTPVLSYCEFFSPGPVIPPRTSSCSTPSSSHGSFHMSPVTMADSVNDFSGSRFVEEFDQTTCDLPRILSSAHWNQASVRASVHVDERSQVNWARPLRSSISDISPSMFILGTSLQRSRRMQQSPSTQTSSPLSNSELHTPSPGSSPSSEHWPTTPPTACAPKIPPRTWSIPVSDVKGLGFGMERDWMESATDSTLANYLLASPSLSTECASPIAMVASKCARVLSSSEYMTELSSPKTLDELRHLRQAAQNLAMELKATTRSSYVPQPIISVPSLEPSLPVTMRERRIKRKAVPAMDLFIDTKVENQRAVSDHAGLSKPTQSVIVAAPEAPPTPIVSYIPAPAHLKKGKAASLGAQKSAPLTPTKKTFYNNMMATKSALTMSLSPSSSTFSSSSSTSFSFFSPSTPTPSPSVSRSSTGRRKMSLPTPRSPASDSGSSSGSSFDDGPLTPLASMSGSTDDRFGSRLDKGMKAWKGSSVFLGHYAEVEAKKGKKAFGRFFRKHPAEA